MSTVVLRGGVLDRLTSFAACRNLIFSPLSANLSSGGDCSISPVIFVVVIGLRELVCDVSGPDYPLSTNLSSSWRLLPRCLLLAWWLPRPLTLRRDVSERAVSAVDVPVERVTSVAVLPVPALWCLATLRVVGTCRNLIRLLSETCRARGDCSSCYLIPVWG